MKNKMCKMLAVAAAVSVSSAALLIGCGDDGGENSVKWEKVDSAAAWTAAMDFSQTTNGSIFIGGMENRNITYCFDGDKVMRKFEKEDGTQSETRYYEYKADEPYPDHDGGTEYYYSYDDDTKTWTVTKDGIYDKFTFADTFDDAIDESLEEYDEATQTRYGKLSERYSDFKYDEKTGSYVAHFDGVNGMKNATIEVRFKNGRVAEGSFKGTVSYEDEGDTITQNLNITYKIYDLGTTKVTLPQVAAQ